MSKQDVVGAPGLAFETWDFLTRCRIVALHHSMAVIGTRIDARYRSDRYREHAASTGVSCVVIITRVIERMLDFRGIVSSSDSSFVASSASMISSAYPTRTP